MLESREEKKQRVLSALAKKASKGQAVAEGDLGKDQIPPEDQVDAPEASDASRSDWSGNTSNKRV